MAIVKNTWDHLQERFFKSIFILNMIALLRNQEYFGGGICVQLHVTSYGCMSLAINVAECKTITYLKHYGKFLANTVV